MDNLSFVLFVISFKNDGSLSVTLPQGQSIMWFYQVYLLVLLVILSYVDVTAADRFADFNLDRNQRLRAGSRDVAVNLGAVDIGPNFRNKRDNVGTNKYAFLSETSVPQSSGSIAAEDSEVAGIDSNTASKSEPQSETNGSELSSLIEKHKDGQLQKLLMESSDLAKELKMVFDIMAKRESQLVDEMERLKSALTGAISVIQQKNPRTTFNIRNRREYVTQQEPPYKACVYIESLPNQEKQPNGGTNQRPKEPIVREFIPDEYGDYYDYRSDSYTQNVKRNQNVQNANRNQNAQNMPYDTTGPPALNNHPSNYQQNENIDLSKVYWLKLPDNLSDESVHKKVETVFGEVSSKGQDVLIIPVSRDFTSTHEISQGFLKALGLPPSSNNKLSRKLRQLNMEIKEIKI